jgi:hypothetical protein
MGKWGNSFIVDCLVFFCLSKKVESAEFSKAYSFKLGKTPSSQKGNTTLVEAWLCYNVSKTTSANFV